jgi:hypothetical protein
MRNRQGLDAIDKGNAGRRLGEDRIDGHEPRLVRPNRFHGRCDVARGEVHRPFRQLHAFADGGHSCRVGDDDRDVGRHATHSSRCNASATSIGRSSLRESQLPRTTETAPADEMVIAVLKLQSDRRANPLSDPTTLAS